MMRYLGIDYGAKRVGVALSDEAGEFVFPLVVLESGQTLIQQLTKLVQENNIGAIVVGESLDFNQKENKIMEEIRPFVQSLETATGLTVSTHPEFMTSIEAERLQGKNDMHDASSAALILKSYLDTKKNK